LYPKWEMADDTEVNELLSALRKAKAELKSLGIHIWGFIGADVDLELSGEENRLTQVTMGVADIPPDVEVHYRG
jgi:hypothetical protein